MGEPVRVENLSYAVGRRTILRDVSLEVPPNGILAIMGLSGSGKSTLLKCMAGLIRPTQGRIFVGDREITALPELELNDQRRRLGMVFQYAALFDSMTVYDNIALGLRYHRLANAGAIQARVTEVLGDVGLAGTERQLPAELSGGMRKRVGLARALVMEPAVIYYDEPTSGLDPIVARVIDELIREVCDARGLTSVVVSHHIESIFRTSDRVAMLHEGQIVAVGTAEEMRTSSNEYVRQFVSGQTQGPIHVSE